MKSPATLRPASVSTNRARMISAMHGRGFTLIEILVALAILATAVAAMVSGISNHINNAAYLQSRTLAHFVALNKFTELQVGGEFPGAGSRSGETLMAGRNWRWEVDISTTEDPDVHRLDIAVYSERGSENPLASMVAYLGRPGKKTVTP
ncbi:MAG TPA: type II secretion system protein GspI [Gammaproteobacteria bacterium]|nr:type II secretion system protein GspI [Gammaproteobacteria bacterium]